MLYDSIYMKYPDMQIHRNRKESNGWGEGNEKWRMTANGDRFLLGMMRMFWN